MDNWKDLRYAPNEFCGAASTTRAVHLWRRTTPPSLFCRCQPDPKRRKRRDMERRKEGKHVQFRFTIILWCQIKIQTYVFFTSLINHCFCLSPISKCCVSSKISSRVKGCVSPRWCRVWKRKQDLLELWTYFIQRLNYVTKIGTTWWQNHFRKSRTDTIHTAPEFQVGLFENLSKIN